MKKIFILILLFFSLFFSFQTAYSQIPTGLVPTGVLIPGLNCGNPNAKDLQQRRCCYYEPVRVSIPKTGVVGLDAIKDIFNSLFDYFFSPNLNKLNQLAANTVQPCLDSSPSTPGNINNPNCTCIVPTVSPLDNIKPLCNNIDRSKGDGEYNKCIDCLSGKSGAVGVWTGIGCVYTDTKTFIQETVFGMGIGLAGGFALLCIIYAAFMMQSSQGNPEKLKKAQEMITSCIMGLMLIIFSVFILRLIGVNILRIPGFS